MAFPADDILLGPRSWGVRPSTAGIIFHTTEYADASRASAVQCARDQSRRTADGGWAQPGSYNFIVYDGGVLLTVPFLEASGGLNPGSPYWNPEPWLRDLLPRAAFSDPTMHHLQISFSGKARVLSNQNYPDNLIQTAARLVLWTEQQPWSSDNLILSAHANWQDNRSDPGAGVIDRILETYEGLKDSSNPVPDYRALYTESQRRVRRLRRRLQSAEQVIADIRDRLSEHSL